MASSIMISKLSMAMIALQSMQSQDLDGDPKQQRRDRPQRRQSPAEAAAFGLVELGDGLRRQQQAVARHRVELIEYAGAAGQQPRRAGNETAQLGDALRGTFQLAGGAEMPRHPFAHH